MASQIISAHLIRLSGTEFRSVKVVCPDCRWSGLAGDLVSPRSALDNSVHYSCPDCKKIIAMHVGLTDQEVLQEMDRIRRELAAELNAHPLHPDTGPARRKSDIDVAAVRAQINLGQPKPVTRQPDAGQSETDNPATVVDKQPRPASREQPAVRSRASAKPKDTAKTNAPDFAAVRARLMID